ncbi:DivIVA domain-containing protein [Nocardioides sp.]|uniref:DivIVA domain-containing protein n=1 Tax=Nocardioides sp. TaxID=35761 RepID=UPI0023935583|nr:DivIVA domain-containing protein [Nocardioides sp.]MDE0777920.1 DivIVA domain-containing protein [Nocardioides sp.]
MIWLTTILVVLALGGIALVASGRGAPMVDEYDDRPDVVVPTGPLSGRDLRRVRFAVTFRGYRMSEVDALLDRVAEQLDAPERWSPDAPPAERPGDDPGPG